MEYTFSKNDTNGLEILRTKGNEHLNSIGFQQIKQEYFDSIIFDNFYVKKKIKSKEDSEGNFYDWYEITNHSRMIDKSPELQNQIDSLLISLLEVRNA